MSKDLRTVENETLNNIIHMAAEAMQLKAGSIDRRVITEEIADSALCIRYQFRGKEVEKIKESTTCSKLYDCISQYQDHLKENDIGENNHKRIVKVHKVKKDNREFDWRQFSPESVCPHLLKSSFTIKETSDILGIDEDTLNSFIESGKINTQSVSLFRYGYADNDNGKITHYEINRFTNEYPEYKKAVSKYFEDMIASYPEEAEHLFGVTRTIKEMWNRYNAE